MLQWNRLHPYNAVHMARLPGAFQAGRLQNDILRTLNRLGLTRLTLSSDQRTGEFGSDAVAPEVRVLSGDAASTSGLLAEAEAQLNRPFPDASSFCPFRFFVLPASGESFWLGVAYFHPVADAEAVVRVVQSVAAALGGREEATSAGCSELFAERPARLLRRHPGAVLHKLVRLPTQLRDMRRFCRPRYRDAGDLRVGVTGSCLQAPELELMLAAARRWEVTVNDLLLAMLLRGLAPLAVGRLKARRRRLALGCIASLRPDLAEAERRRFGLLLGMFVVSHEVAEEMGLRALALEVRRQTLFIKRHKLHVATPVDLALARGLMTFFSPERRRTFYPKHHPLWGGLTNMNLNRLWPATAAGAPLDYWRAVATGPVAPLVLSATTFGEHLNLTWNYRTAAFTSAEIEAVQERFAAQLTDLSKDP